MRQQFRPIGGQQSGNMGGVSALSGQNSDSTGSGRAGDQISQQVQSRNSTGATGNTGIIADVAESNSSKNSGCFRCLKPGHVAKECTEILFCIHYRRPKAHISDKCVMLNRPIPVAKLAGCVADGLQLMVAQSGKKVAADGQKNAWGLVSILEGRISADALTVAFKKQFPWGGAWPAKEFGLTSLKIQFQSAQKLDQMLDYPFGLKGTDVVIQLSKLTEGAGVVFKLHSVWVRAIGVPKNFNHIDGFAEVGSLIGTFQDADMVGFGESGNVRI